MNLIIFIAILIIFVLIYFLYYKSKHLSETKQHKNILYHNVYKRYGITKKDMFIPETYTFAENYMKLFTKNFGKNIFCIQGSDKLAGKNNLWNYMIEKYPRYNLQQILPNTFLIENERDMYLFQKSFNPKINYYLKKNIQKKKGIYISNNYNDIMKTIENDQEFVVIQEEIPNLFLINKRKINLRIFLLIHFEDGVQKWYISKLGKCIYTNKEYSSNSRDFEENVTSFNLDTSIYNKNPFTLDELRSYIGFKNYEILWNRMCKIISKCKNAFFNKINFSVNKNNNCFQLLGLDFIFTKDLQPFLLECNKGPQMLYINKKEKEMKEKIILDVLTTCKIVSSDYNKMNDFNLIK